MGCLDTSAEDDLKYLPMFEKCPKNSGIQLGLLSTL